jgi:hypothetical protein
MASVSNHDQASYTVKAEDAARILLVLNNHMERIKPEIDANVDAIAAEVAVMDALREQDAILHAQTSLVFAIISPQCWFGHNVAATRRIMDRLYDNFETVDDVYRILTNDGAMSWVTAGGAARGIFTSLDTIRNIEPEDMTKDNLLALKKQGKLRNVGEKTAAMAVALFNGDADVFTLDVHMLRMLQSFVGGITATSMTVNKVPYRMLEATLVEWARQNGYRPFVLQWAMWQIQHGYFESHLGIFGY